MDSRETKSNVPRSGSHLEQGGSSRRPLSVGTAPQSLRNIQNRQHTLLAPPLEETADLDANVSNTYWPAPDQYTDPDVFADTGIGTEYFSSDDIDILSGLDTLVNRVYVPPASSPPAVAQPSVATQNPHTGAQSLSATHTQHDTLRNDNAVAAQRTHAAGAHQ